MKRVQEVGCGCNRSKISPKNRVGGIRAVRRTEKRKREKRILKDATKT